MDPATIAAFEARSSCAGEPDIIERIKKAMRACHGHWMVTDETQQFRAAIAAALMESAGEEKDRIERSAKKLNQLGALLSALQAGVPVDIEAMAAEPEQPDLLPLRKLWDETKPKR